MTEPQLPTPPPPPRAIIARGIVMACCTYALYSLLLSDNGLLLALAEPLRALPEQSWAHARCWFITLWFAALLLHDFIRCCLGKGRWGEWFLTLLCSYIAYSQLLVLNVSPLS